MIILALETIEDTYKLAQQLAEKAESGDIIFLKGDLGSGKTEFARGFIRALTSPFQEVPSPTFSLVQLYDTPKAPVWHFDLYRLENANQAWELGLEEAVGEGISLIEWPERLQGLPFKSALELEFSIKDGTDKREVKISMDEKLKDRLAFLKGNQKDGSASL
jgi:tRNA threonylcarbamoyladenosine biosynthesis protein TsaE